VLLIDLDGLGAGLDAQVEAILKICREAGCTEVRAAKSPEERLKWWTIRKGAFGAAGNLAPNYVVQDGVIPRSKLTEILAACVRAGGTISGEHGIGIEKMAGMNVVFTPGDLTAQRAVHDALDPRDLSNPRKIFPV